ncbi:oligosaccharide flippase family protein [Candidatus Woesearchaeota archaeon]|jgi:stage V sporulation protein B|nr:oligosaccharide flippase family protein [Candidatus Woesearchaeota archaeon]MBT6045171.1 oligosaccharide flippase family protein [Candidatus Woesearchaeota archaeon]
MKKESIGNLILRNSLWNSFSALIAKLGGFIFTIVIARLLLPELFGLYSLVLSIALIAMVLTDAGTSSGILMFIPKALKEKNNRVNARSNFRYLLKVKGLVMSIVILLLLILARPLAYNFFEKPAIFLPILLATLYIITTSMKDMFYNLFVSLKELSRVPVITTIYHLSKIILSIVAVILLPVSYKISGIFVAFSLAALIALVYILVLLRKNKDLILGKIKEIKKPRINKYLLHLSFASLTLVIFGSMDTLMLSKFVEPEFLGYYRAALSLALAIPGFFAIWDVILPIFTQVNQKSLEKTSKDILRFVMMLSIPAAAGLIVLARQSTLLIYGKEYILATAPLIILSTLVITSPLIAFHSSVLKAKENTKFLAKFILISALLNIALNYILISYLIKLGPIHALMGAAIATVFSRVFLLAALASKNYTAHNILPLKLPIIKFFISSSVMAIAIILFNKLINLNPILGLIEIPVGILIYFGVLLIIKGVTVDEIKALRPSRR